MKKGSSTITVLKAIPIRSGFQIKRKIWNDLPVDIIIQGIELHRKYLMTIFGEFGVPKPTITPTLCADVKGYSKLMSEDESYTVGALKERLVWAIMGCWKYSH